MADFKQEKGTFYFKLTNSEVSLINSSEQLIQICIKAFLDSQSIASKEVTFVVSKIVGLAYKNLKSVNQQNGSQGVVIIVSLPKSLLMTSLLGPLATAVITPKVEGIHVW